MKLIKNIFSYCKIIWYYFTNKKIKQIDYKDEYDIVSKTYSLWIEKMGKYTDNIIKPQYIIENIKENGKNKENIEILDFACGTGYITKKILEEFNANNFNRFKITSNDISCEMINFAKKNIIDKRVYFIEKAGLEFLKNTENEKYNAIFCGWAMPYFDYNLLIKEFYRTLKSDGIIAVILNCRGTLNHIEEIFVETMLEYSSSIQKIMDIRFSLPKNTIELNKWFRKYNFDSLEEGAGEEKVYFDKPDELYKWLRETGAIAGTGKIFNKNEIIEKTIIEKIRKKCFFDSKYIINHKFVYAIFQKKQ